MKKLTRKGYKNYLAAYNKKKEQFNKKGLEFYDDAGAYSYTEWKQMYAAKRIDRVDLVNKGEAKRVGNINQYLVSEQAYHESIEQAKKVKVAAEHLGHKFTLAEIRGGLMPWNEIDEIYTELKAQGYKGKAAKQWISYNLFDSK